MALVLEGRSRTEAAQTCGMDRQTPRDWVQRDTAAGLAGLCDRAHPGRAPRLTAAQMAELAAAPTCAIATRCGVRCPERTGGKRLKKLNFAHLSGRPQHPERDPQAQEAFTFARLGQTAVPEHARAKPIEIWFQARVGQPGTLTRIWAKRGPRPRAPGGRPGPIGSGRSARSGARRW